MHHQRCVVADGVDDALHAEQVLAAESAQHLQRSAKVVALDRLIEGDAERLHTAIVAATLRCGRRRHSADALDRGEATRRQPAPRVAADAGATLHLRDQVGGRLAASIGECDAGVDLRDSSRELVLRHGIGQVALAQADHIGHRHLFDRLEVRVKRRLASKRVHQCQHAVEAVIGVEEGVAG